MLTFLHVHVIFPYDTYSDCCLAKAQLVKMKLELSWNVSGVVNFAFKYIFDWLQCFLARPLPCWETVPRDS